MLGRSRRCRGASRCQCVGSPRIQLALRRPRVLTQSVRRGAHGPNEPRSIAKLAGCDIDGSREEGGKGPSDQNVAHHDGRGSTVAAVSVDDCE
jgi:hypothetical protein